MAENIADLSGLQVVKDSNYTSAGITIGIDLALLFVEEDFGPRKAFAIAQLIMLFVRRNASYSQISKLLALQSSSLKPFDHLENWISSTSPKTSAASAWPTTCT